RAPRAAQRQSRRFSSSVAVCGAVPTVVHASRARSQSRSQSLPILIRGRAGCRRRTGATHGTVGAALSGTATTRDGDCLPRLRNVERQVRVFTLVYPTVPCPCHAPSVRGVASSASRLGGMVSFAWQNQLAESARAGVTTMLAAARASDGRPDLPADGSLPDEFRGGRYLGAADGDEVVGCAHLDTAGDVYGRRVAEVVVHPEHRRRGIGTRLARELVDTGADAERGDTLRVWSHGDHPGAAALATRLGFERARELWVMRCDATDSTGASRWNAPTFPADTTVRTFVPGEDEQALVERNARAFSWHPGQGAFSLPDLDGEKQQD